MAKLRGPSPLAREDIRDGFDCGVASLDTWLVEHAPGADAVGSARTYVVVDEEQDRVIGYHALTVASLEELDRAIDPRVASHEPSRMSANAMQPPIPRCSSSTPTPSSVATTGLM